MVEQKIKYIETFPDKIDITFDSAKDFYEYYSKRLSEVAVILDFYSDKSKYRYNDWKKIHVRLNKDGSPRKPYYPEHLQTKESREKQKVKFAEYQEKRKQKQDLAREQRKQLDKELLEKATYVLLENKIDLSRLIIKLRFGGSI